MLCLVNRVIQISFQETHILGQGIIRKSLLNAKNKTMSSSRPSSDMSKFRGVFKRSKHIVVLTGAGISAESGIPTFRGAGGLWRTYKAQDLATPQAFYRDPSLVWEFYHHRREVVFTKQPNKAHYALAEAEKCLSLEGRKLVIVTQNIDGLHQTAGSGDVTELHGSLFKTECTKCGKVEINRDSPICEALRGKGAPSTSTAQTIPIPQDQLPRCTTSSCGGLTRPHVVWFGESLDNDVLNKAENELDQCDMCLVVGTSSVVYPAAMFAPRVAQRGVPVAEFNIESTPETMKFGFHFEGQCGTLLPEALRSED